MKFWLIKSEPHVFSIKELQKQTTTIWEGVRNVRAKNNLLNMKIDDICFFYHSSCKIPGIVGLAKVIETNIVDITQFDKDSQYYDTKSTNEKPRWFTVKIKYLDEFKDMISLQHIKSKYNPKEIELLRIPRLSVMPIDDKIAYVIIQMDEILSKFTDKYNCESSDRFDDYFLQQYQKQDTSRPLEQLQQIEIRFKRSNQTYVFPRIYCQQDSDESIQSVNDLRTIESPKKSFSRLKTEGNEKSEEQFDLNFNFNSSSEQLSEDAVVLEPKKGYQQKLKPPVKRCSQNIPYKSILNDLERKLHTLNCKDFYKTKKSQPKKKIKTENEFGRMKSNSNSTTHQSYYNTQYLRPASQKSRKFEKNALVFTEITPLQTKTSSIQKSIPISDSKKILKKQDTINCHDYLMQILQKHKSRSNPKQQGPIFNVNNSNINLNVNINSHTVEVPRRIKRPAELQEQNLTVAQILKKKNIATNNRSSVSSYQQRNSNRCSTEPIDDNLRQKFNKKKKQPASKQQTRCNTGMEQLQNTQSYLNNLKIQQEARQRTVQIGRNSVKMRSLEVKYKKNNLQIEMI